MPETRVLFVDDDPAIRQTMPAILRHHGFNVTVAASVYEALATLSAYNFDVLVSDLNVGEPGDGFTIVSAMRRTQPNAVTIILTGYPAFETALKAIRSQVDDYIVKSSDEHAIVSMIRERLSSRKPHEPATLERAAVLLKRLEQQILDEWVLVSSSDEELGAFDLSYSDRLDRISSILHESLEGALSARVNFEAMTQAAAAHGAARRAQGYSAQLMLREARLLRRILGSKIQEHLLSVDVSFIVPDMNQIADLLDEQIAESLRVFMQEPRLSALPPIKAAGESPHLRQETNR